MKQNNVPIPSNLFIFDTRWFEKVGVVGKDAESSENNHTDTDIKEKEETHDKDSMRNDHFHGDDNALVLAPPRKILKALEDKMALEQSGQFVVGANLDSDIPDILRDPLRFLPYEIQDEKEPSIKQSSSFHRETFSKISSAFLEGTRKRQVHQFNPGEDNEELDGPKHENVQYNNKASVIDGFITLLKFMWQCVGEYERFMQNHNLLPAYKYTILRHQSSHFKSKFEEGGSSKFHLDNSFDDDAFFEGSVDPCDAKDMELKHQRCVVSFLYEDENE